MLSDIMDSRVQQKLEKEKRMHEAAQLEQEEFFRILDRQRQLDATERAKEETEKQRRLAHKEQILQQITELEEKRLKDRQEFLEEGSKMRFERELEKKRLEAIKQRKLHELKRAGVPNKYTIELANKKVDNARW